MKAISYDIVIVGGGIVGLALACMFAQKTRLSVAVLESQSQSLSWDKESYHHRVSAITLSSQRIFDSINVWNDICDSRVSPFKQIQVWDAAKQGEINFYSKEIAESVLGFIVENNLIQEILENKIKQYSQIHYFTSIKLKNFLENEHDVEFITESGDQYKAKLAIAADGGHSWLRQQAKINVSRKDYQQEGIVANVQTDMPHQQIARQIFLETGPLAFLPLAQPNHSSIVWSLPVKESQRLMSLSEWEFKQALASAFEYRLGDVQQISRRFHFPLVKQQAEDYVKSRVVLVGDAAHVIHPLVGQGVNMGLLDAATLMDVLMDAQSAQRNIFALHTLRQYERWRKADNQAMFLGVDVIQCLFDTQNTVAQQVRSIGLNLTNRFNIIKNMFTHYAVGNRRGMPSLAQKN